MPLPKKIKKDIPLTQSKILLERRRELVDKINQDGTYLPKSLLHADLDGGFLDFVKNELRLVVDGKLIPNVDILMTTQNWAQFTQTWEFQNVDKNAEPPFITIVRTPEVKMGNNPAIMYNIPNRRQFFYAQVPTWDGNRVGMDVYKIPQPVPVDIIYQVKIVCNRMKELNQFNKLILEKFSSMQAYQVIKGHYIPIKLGGITDESVMEMEKRKYYIQSYEFTMMGFLIDENEFEVSPAISRVLQVVEFDSGKKNRGRKKINIERSDKFFINFSTLELIKLQKFDLTSNVKINNTSNVLNFDVYINDDFYGTNIYDLEINTNDVVKFQIEKDMPSNTAQIELVLSID
jgi:hypothetical protein